MYQRYVEVMDVPANIRRMVRKYKRIHYRIRRLRNISNKKYFSDAIAKYDYLDKKGNNKLNAKGLELFDKIRSEWLKTYPPQVGESVEYNTSLWGERLEGTVMSWNPSTQEVEIKQKNNHRITLDINSVGYEMMFCNTNVWVDMSSSH